MLPQRNESRRSSGARVTKSLATANAFVLFVAMALGCTAVSPQQMTPQAPVMHEDTLPLGTPTITGNITIRTLEQRFYTDANGVQRSVPYPRLLVEGDSARDWPTTRRYRDRMALTFDSKTCILDATGRRLSTEDLRVGRRVSAWAQGIVLTSYPGQAHAATIILGAVDSSLTRGTLKKRCQ